jgi:hypothetical protein
MDDSLEQFVRSRAGDACEYCRLPQRFSHLTFSIDHVIARQHKGETIDSNLALACPFCNRHKGPNIAGIDPETKQITRLFHPRSHLWAEHFLWNGSLLFGKTAIGRTTIVVLAINHAVQVAMRNTVIDEEAEMDPVRRPEV